LLLTKSKSFHPNAISAWVMALGPASVAAVSNRSWTMMAAGSARNALPHGADRNRGAGYIRSSTLMVAGPRRSGRMRTFLEVDCAGEPRPTLDKLAELFS
jgi:hypothetical protein